MQNPLNRDRALYIGTCFLWALIRNRGRGEIILELYCSNSVGRYCIFYTCVQRIKQQHQQNLRKMKCFYLSFVLVNVESTFTTFSLPYFRKLPFHYKCLCLPPYVMSIYGKREGKCSEKRFSITNNSLT